MTPTAPNTPSSRPPFDIEALSALSLGHASGPVHEGTSFYEGRCFCKADVAASSGYGPPPGRCEPLVMSGSGACAELLSALSLGHASGPVHEGTSFYEGRSFRKADVAAFSGYGAPFKPLVMSGRGACAKLLSALSMGHASGPVHEGTSFYEGRCFCKADVAASSGKGAPPGRCEPLVMSGIGACAELLSALSMGRASGPVHEGILLPGGAAICFASSMGQDVPRSRPCSASRARLRSRSGIPS